MRRPHRSDARSRSRLAFDGLLGLVARYAFTSRAREKAGSVQSGPTSIRTTPEPANHVGRGRSAETDPRRTN